MTDDLANLWVITDELNNSVAANRVVGPDKYYRVRLHPVCGVSEGLSWSQRL